VGRPSGLCGHTPTPSTPYVRVGFKVCRGSVLFYSICLYTSSICLYLPLACSHMWGGRVGRRSLGRRGRVNFGGIHCRAPVGLSHPFPPYTQINTNTHKHTLKKGASMRHAPQYGAVPSQARRPSPQSVCPRPPAAAGGACSARNLPAKEFPAAAPRAGRQVYFSVQATLAAPSPPSSPPPPPSIQALLAAPH
jgi:hypothetical protein